MSARPPRPKLSIPRHWTNAIQSALVQVISLAHYALVSTRSWAANGSNDRARLAAKADQLEQKVTLLREEIRIKDARMEAIPPAATPTASALRALC